MDPQTVRTAIDQYLTKLGQKINVSEAILYGSVASNSATPDSDVDLIVISNDFSDLDSDTRSQILYRASVGFPYDLHVHGFTSQEFDNASPLTSLGQIKKQQVLKI